MGTIAAFAVKPFSSKVKTPLQTSQVIETVFSTNLSGFHNLTENWLNKNVSKTRPQGQGQAFKDKDL